MFDVMKDLIFTSRKNRIALIIPTLLISSLFCTIAKSQNDIAYEDIQDCIGSGEMCGEVTDCCASLECDVNEPIARCVETIKLENQNEDYEGSGQALIEQASTNDQNFSKKQKSIQPNNNKLKQLKKKIMSIFQQTKEETTTEQFTTPRKILKLEALTYRPIATTTTSKISVLLKTLFTRDTFSLSSSDSNDFL